MRLGLGGWEEPRQEQAPQGRWGSQSSLRALGVTEEPSDCPTLPVPPTWLPGLLLQELSPLSSVLPTLSYRLRVILSAERFKGPQGEWLCFFYRWSSGRGTPMLSTLSETQHRALMPCTSWCPFWGWHC